MELAGLEPATSWVRSSGGGVSWALRGGGLSVIDGDSATALTIAVRSPGS